MLVPQLQEPVLLLCLIALLILAVGATHRSRIREFLRFVRDALYDEWQRPR